MATELGLVTPGFANGVLQLFSTRPLAVNLQSVSQYISRATVGTMEDTNIIV